MATEYRIIKEFVKDYNRYGKFDLEKQVPHLAGLADHYRRQYKRTGDWRDCLKAHTLYNSISIRQPEDECWCEKAFEMQQLFWGESASVTYEEQRQRTRKLKAELKAIRVKLESERLAVEEVVKKYEDEKIEDAVDGQFYEGTKAMSVRCSEMMINFASRVVEESVKLINESSPCGFQAIAIGSLARGEATPYSDLEYLFLIEMDTPEMRKYCERLAVTTYFLIGNLGETKLTNMAIDELYGWFDDRARNGFQIDGLAEAAGNISTGNGASGEPNQFIATPYDLASYYRKVYENPQQEAVRGDLTAMLTYTVPFYSQQKQGQNLLQELRREVDAMVPNEARRAINLKMLQTDAEKFNFLLNDRLICSGFNVHVKKDLYRFPSILLMDLGILFGLTSKTSWDALENLIQQNTLSADIGNAVKFCLAAAVYIRLSVYQYHDSHDDRISVASQNTQNSTPCSIKHMRWFLPYGLFYKLVDKFLPVKRILLQSCQDKNISELGISTINVDAAVSNLSAQFFSGRHSQAMSSLRQICGGTSRDKHKNPFSVLSIKERFGDMSVVKLIADILFHSGNFHDALDLYFFLDTQLSKDNRIMRARCQIYLGRIEEAIEQLNEINRDHNSFPGSIGELIMHVGMAEIHELRREYEKAEARYLQALYLEISIASRVHLTDYYGNPIPLPSDSVEDSEEKSPVDLLASIQTATPTLLTLLNNLGEVYNRVGKSELAKHYLYKALDLSHEFYGKDTVEICSGLILVNLGQVYHETEYYKKAIQLYKEALNAVKGDMQAVTIILNCLGSSYTEISEYKKAESCFLESLKMHDREKLLENSWRDLHIYRAIVHCNLGRVYDDLCDIENRDECYNKAYTAVGDITQVDDISIKITVLEKLGQYFYDTEQYMRAEECLTQALHLYNHSRSLGGAVAMRILGTVYLKTGRSSEAACLFVQALSRCRLQSHNIMFSKAMTLGELGLHYAIEGQLHRAIEYGYLALSLCSGDSYVNADITYYIGSWYWELGGSSKTREAYSRALAMYRRITPPGRIPFSERMSELEAYFASKPEPPYRYSRIQSQPHTPGRSPQQTLSQFGRRLPMQET